MSGKPTRMDGYVRVSRRMGREGAGYLSPTIQRDAIQRWATYRGVEITEWHVDEDESGGTQQRPGIRAAMSRVEAGDTQGIACWRLNRFARNVAEALEDVERIHKAGGALACVEEDIDPTGPFGGFILTVLLAVAALELNNVKAGWVTAKASAMSRGAVIGPTPYGYQRRDDGTLEVDPVAGPVVGRAFDVAAGQGLAATHKYLSEHGEGRAWTMSTTRRFLSQRCYLGTFEYGDLRYADPDLALTTRSVWERAQPTEPKGRTPAAHYPLSGLARCGTCDTHMIGARSGRSVRTYRCAASLTSWKGQPCPAPATTVAGPLEALVRDSVAVAADRADNEIVDIGEATRDLTDAQARLEDAERELDATLMDLTLRRTLGDTRYHQMVEARVRAVDECRTAHGVLLARQASPLGRVGLGDHVRDCPHEELGLLLRGIVGAVMVERGRGPIDGRVRLLPLQAERALRVLPSHDT